MDRVTKIVVNWLEVHGPSIIVALLVFLTGQWFIRIIRKWLHGRMERHELSPSMRPFFQSFILTSLQILLVIIVLQILSVRLTILTAVVTSFGVAAGLALSGTLQNVTSGIILLLLKPFKIGDNIIAQGYDGIVESIEIFYTIIQTDDNRSVIIPNSMLSNQVIVNISREGSRRIDIELKFSYAQDPAKVIPVIEKTLAESAFLLHDPAPYVGINTLAPDGFVLAIQAWVPTHQYDSARFNLQQKLLESLKNSGIKLPGMV